MSDSPRTLRQSSVQKLAGVDPSDIANAQTDIPLAYQAGEGMGAVAWISPIYTPVASATTTTTGKK